MNCDRIARAYRWIEYAVFGRALERTRFAFLDKCSVARRVLVLGDGDGRFLARLATLNRPATIDAIDSSARMLELARRRTGAGGIRYEHADARMTAFPSAEYDLIVTHFFLDCFDEHDQSALIRKIATTAAPGALWIVSEFRESKWSRPLLAVMYRFFAVTTGLRTRGLVDHRSELARSGFVLEESQPALRGLLTSELWKKVAG